MEIKDQLNIYKERGLKVFATSSFQTQSVVLLHLLSKIDIPTPVYFLNTGFHFPETLEYKNRLTQLFGLKVIDVFSDVPRIQQRNEKNHFFYACDPDYCCYLNKERPMEPVLQEYDVWLTGVRADQSKVRNNLKIEQPVKHGVLKYHPMLGWTGKMIYEYINKYKLPKHPLDDKGYVSVGCQPCTVKYSFDSDTTGREGRWSGMSKTECGLHTNLIEK